jgi:hypothetical protein
MQPIDLPSDLAAFLRDKRTPQLATVCYGRLDLIPLDELCVQTIAVSPTLAPFADQDPHDGWGGYLVPVINLNRKVPDTCCPSCLLVWLPNERRYGSVDQDHGDLMMFMPDVTWSQIAANPEAFVLATESCGNEGLRMEYLKPWPQYPWEEP